ncbi:MAG: competence/damage-inducible protein A [Acidimicrobiia bacterium]|nr:competence/damage-inducible protein A [Acidimicrobiia bacterium]MYH05475.1 competence/damage-inducible protein A [Acidimicrobiia bacterium]MYJ15022.1 competence/damage-inducible protein A [Acidimicrobiia bacterium]MYK56482.1 competence/damage-inducible protein A [Acidimicrobiia bacterium]
MIVEVITVGTELLLGQILNGNAAFIGEALAAKGFDAHFQVTVGDNPARMEAAIATALDRADAVIITGGIGPTPDDLTREAICAVTGRSLWFSSEWAEVLRERFSGMGREMPSNNLRQAEYPEGAELIENPRGTAPGLALSHQGKWIFAVPGVPREMAGMLAEDVLPRLTSAAGISETLVSRVIRTWGRSESGTAELLEDLFLRSENPSLAYLASAGEIKVRVTAKAADVEAAERMIAPLSTEICRRLGPAVFGFDDQTIEMRLMELLAERGWTIGTAESMTAGMVAARITLTPGSSRVFRGSVVSYASDLKQRMLGVSAEALEDGAVSARTAREMAEGARRTLGVDVGLAVTGSAGPAPADRPVGVVYVGVATPGRVESRRLQMPGDRERVRVYTTTAALHLARLGISGVWWNR